LVGDGRWWVHGPLCRFPGVLCVCACDVCVREVCLGGVDVCRCVHVGCPVARLVSGASVSAGGGPASQLLCLALGLMCPVRASMSWVLCVVVSYSPPSRVPMCGFTETHWVGWPSLLMIQTTSNLLGAMIFLTMTRWVKPMPTSSTVVSLSCVPDSCLACSMSLQSASCRRQIAAH